MNIPTAFLPLIQHLHRGGTYGNWWTGNTKRSTWWTVDAPDALPDGRDNLYFGVHPTTAIPPTNAKGETAPPSKVRSQVDYIAAINCLFGEYDAKHFDADDRANGKALALAHIDALAVQPSVVIDSGGGYHCFWLSRETFILSSDDDRERAKRLQAAWVKFVGSDDDAKDLARVLRVPGTRNYKKDYAPHYPTVEIVHADYTRLYDLDALEALLPVPAVQTRHTRRPAAPRATQDDATERTTDLGTIATVALQLQRLSTDRKDRYSDWLQVGMALRELGAIGLELWNTWSKGSAKYEPGACAEKWYTIRVDTAGITLASLDRWIQEDAPVVETATTDDDVARMDADTLRQRLRSTIAERDRQRQRADRLDDWRAWCIAVVAKPGKDLSPAQKIIALSLHTEMDYRQQNGITEPAPILIGTIEKDDRTIPGLADRAGVSHDTFSKALPKLAETGAIAYEQTRDKRTGHTRVSIAPAAYFTPALWTPPVPRNHGGTRTSCTRCGSLNLATKRTTTCRDCGLVTHGTETLVNPDANIQTPPTAETQVALRGSEPTMTDETPTAETQVALLKKDMVSLVPQVAVWPSNKPKQQPLLDDIDLLPLSDLLPDVADERIQPEVLPTGRKADETPAPTMPAPRLANSYLLQRHAAERDRQSGAIVEV